MIVKRDRVCVKNNAAAVAADEARGVAVRFALSPSPYEH